MYAASFDPALCHEDDANGDGDDEYNIEEEPQTENTIPSGLLPSPKHGSKNGQSLRNSPPPSRKGKIVQVIQRGGDFDWNNNNNNWQGRRGPHPSRGNGNNTYCPPYLVIHDGQYAAIAFLSPETLQELSSSPTIISNRSLVSITNYTVSTILQCCQKQGRQQQKKKQPRGQGQQQQAKKLTFDFDTHSGILNHLYFTATNINNTNNHHHPHEPNGYTLIPPTIQTQLPHQIPNNELYLCLYIQGTITMIGAENQGLIGFPKDVHCSIPLRRVLREHEEMYESFWNGDGNGTLSHFMLIDKLEAVHGYYRMLDQKKYGGEEVVVVVDNDDDDDEVEDDNNDEEEDEGEQQHDPPRRIVGGRTKKQYGQRGRKKRDKVVDRHRTATSTSRTKRTTTTTTTTSSKSLMTNIIPGWPWESRLVEGHPSRIAPTARAAAASAPGASAAAASNNDTNGNEDEIASAMLMMRNSLPGQDDSGDIADGEEGRVSAAAASARGGGNPNTEAAMTPTAASTPHPPLGNVQELLELGLDIEQFLGVESQSESDDNAVSAVGDSNDDRNHNTEVINNDEEEDGGIEKEAEAPIDKISGQLEPHEQQQSPRRESAFGTQEETGHEASFVGINDMLVDEDDDADGDNGHDEQNDIDFEDLGDNYDDLDGNERLLQTQPESTAYYHASHSPNRARETVDERDSQTPLSIRNAGNQPLRPTDEYSRSLQRIEEVEDVVAKASSRRKQSRRNNSKRRSEEEDDKDEYPITMSQRKVPPETLDGCAVLESQIPVPPPRGTSREPVARANDEEDDEAKDEEDDDQLVGGQSQLPISTKSRRVVEYNQKAGRSTIRSKRWIEEDDEEDDYPIPVSQRKAPPETLEGYAVLESQIPLPPPRGASRVPIAREEEKEEEQEEEKGVVEEKEEEREEDDDDDPDENDEDYYPPGRRSQIPISTKSKRVEKQTKWADNSTARNAKQLKSPRKEIHISDDDSGERMRVRKHKKQDDSESEDSSDDWMKVHKITNLAKRHRAVNDDVLDDDEVVDDINVDDDASDDDASDESYEPTFEAQMAGEGSEEAVPPSPGNKSFSNIETSGKRAAGNHRQQQHKPSKEAKANYDVAAFSSKASIMLGFSSSKVSVQKKVGKKKTRGEQFDVASFVNKAQRLCGL